MRFSGSLLDADTGLYHMRARQYDPSNGRFHSVDPLLPDRASPYISAYVYAENRPTVLIDPSGLGSVDADACTNVFCWFGSGNLTWSGCLGICLGLAVDGSDVFAYTGCCGLRPGGSITWSPGDISESDSWGWMGCYYACVGGTETSEGEPYTPALGIGAPGFQAGRFAYLEIW